MKFTTKILLLFSTILIISCGNKQQKKSTNSTSQESTITGTYSGEIPCASCEAIQYEIEFNKNNTYQKTLIYKGENEAPIINKGSYTISTDGIIKLNDNPDSQNYLKKVPNGLLLLDTNGKIIDGDLAKLYLLTPKEKAEENENEEATSENNETDGFQQILMKKQQEGVDFYAVGNEPFWSLEIDFDKTIHFKTMNGLEFTAPAVEPDLAQDHHVKRYKSVTEKGEIIVQITQEECSDTMADREFPYQILVKIKTKNETEYSNFEGCGMFVPDFRLTDIWAIVEVNETPINIDEFQNNPPQIDINSYNQTVFGSNGCNRLSGTIKNEQNNLYFGPMMTTLMACDQNQEISNAINAALSKKDLTYTIENNYLTIFSNNEKIMVLKHID